MALKSEIVDRILRLGFRAGISQDVAKAFATAYARLDPVEAARINPLVFAAEAGLDAQTVLTLLVTGAHEGLFSFEWGLVCPMCGAFTHTLDSISDVTEEYHCGFCDIDVPTTLDDAVEVTFACPSTRFDPHADLAGHFRYQTSQSFPYRDELLAYHQRNTLAEARIVPGQTADLHLTVAQGEVYRLITLDTHALRWIRVDPQAAARAVIEVIIDETGFSPAEITVPPGPLHLVVSNRHGQKVWVQAMRLALEEVRGLNQHDLRAPGPRLTGKHLLTNQTFRDLFGIQHLIPDLHIRVQAITVLFTDLKGSTELYDRAGDVPAYDLVQKHFQVLRQRVKDHSGAIVKTMGDAIMAAFPDPEQAVRAAVAMMQGIDDLSGQLHPEELGLKIGIHTGPALTVNTGGTLDFFGQTVNIAARVQGLAEAGEICISDTVSHSAPQTLDLLTGSNYALMTEISRLKGVAQERRMIRCVPL